MSSDDPRPAPARSFGAVAEAYDRGRPGYPGEVASWLTADSAAAPLRILELGAGTGKLTAELVALGHDVHATDVDAEMLAVLRRRLPDVPTSQTGAEEIEAGDATYDVVVSAQAFHWFDLNRALPEIARVLRPRGTLSLVWNCRDERIPWVRRLGRIIGTSSTMRAPMESLEASELFDDVHTEEFTFWQGVDRSTIQDLVLSRSNVAVLDDRGRADKLAEALALYDDYGRGMDGMQLPYVARCFRTTSLDRLTPNLTLPGPTFTTYTADTSDRLEAVPTSGSNAAAPSDPALSDGSSTDLLLIDYR